MYRDANGFYHQDYAGESVACAMANAMMADMVDVNRPWPKLGEFGSTYSKRGWNMEADIVINGVHLSSAQSMAVRAAISHFKSEMSDPDALGSDEMGRAIAKGYLERLREVESIIFMDKH